MATAAKKALQPDELVWVLVGDKSIIEPKIRELNLGTIKTIDTDGNVSGM